MQDLKAAADRQHAEFLIELHSINAPPGILLESNSFPRDQVIIDLDSIAQG
jgi:hypothetical protein